MIKMKTLRTAGNKLNFQYFKVGRFKVVILLWEVFDMKYKILLRIFMTAIIITTTMAAERFVAPLLPTFPIPNVEPTPEYSPPKPDAVPVCQTVTVNHTGIKVSQEPGDVLVCQPFPTPTPAMSNFATTSTVVKTTNTTTTEVRTVTTTTTTTIEATTTSTNTTVPMEIKPCVAQGGNGTQYNWWQILTESGGKPGMLNSNRNPSNPVDSAPVDPCVRPLQSQYPKMYTYKYRERHIREEDLRSKKLNFSSLGSSYIREEIGYTRMYGTPDEFLDVRGDFVWRPPTGLLDNVHTYSVYYVLDDTGFWVNVMPLFYSDGKQWDMSLLVPALNPLRGAPLKMSDLNKY